MASFSSYSPKMICGDFNARLIKALPHERAAIGPHTFGIGTQDLHYLSDRQLANRSNMVEFCLEHRLVISKPPEQLVTYRAVGVPDWRPPFDFHKYAQLDFILINSPWKNCILNVSSSYIHTLDTDHKLLCAKVRFKLKAKVPCPPKNTLKFHSPNPAQLQQYNTHIALNAASADRRDMGSQLTLDDINSLILKGAKAELPCRHPAQKKDYISADTWQLLEKKWDALNNGDWETAKALDQTILARVRQDRETHLLAQLEEIHSSGYRWEGLKRLRAKFTPHFTKFKDSEGNFIPYDLYPEKAAEYLESKQWGRPANPEDPPPSRIQNALQNGSYIVDDSPFTFAELDYVLSRAKRNKSPGFDGVPSELFKWLDTQNRQLILDAANQCLAAGHMPPHHLKALVVSIYKKGDSSQLSNYRPISLLNSCYKITAALVKERLDKGLDAWLTQTQYGFRKGRSTAQAIFLARRIQDLSEKSNSARTLILLDWEKAFDKVFQDKMIETLIRLKVPSKLVSLIQSFYTEPLFKVSMNGQDSDWKCQGTGIRQGCPLSPYLFCLVMGALFTDIKAELNTPRQKQPIDGIHFSEILYADDTLIFGANTHCIIVLLHAIEKHSEYYGLKLNYDKCVNLTSNQQQSSVHFSPNGPALGAKVPRKGSALYLGTMLSDNFDNKAEVSNRLGDCIATCNRLKLFWAKAKTSIRWKIQVFNAVVRSKLLYGLECLQLTAADISRLNAFQNKSLRRILGIPPTFIDREQTNARMYASIQQQYGCTYESFGDTWRKTKCRLFGHILRAPRSDPLVQVTLNRDGVTPKNPAYRRPGRPRADWVVETYRDASILLFGPDIPFDISDHQLLTNIKQAAINRQGPFATRI